VEFQWDKWREVLKVDTVEVEEDENVETVKSRRHSASEIVVSPASRRI
jgi:hypothetical protein